MRKLLGFFAAIAAVAFMSCSGGAGGAATPTEVAEQSMKCIQNKDYKGYVDLINFPETMKESEVKNQKAMYVNMMENKMKESVEKAGGIKEFKAAGEENVTDTTATVKMNVTYGNDSTAVQNVDCVKAKDGSWKLKSNK